MGEESLGPQVLTCLQLPPKMHNENDKAEIYQSCKRGRESINRSCSHHPEPTSISLEKTYSSVLPNLHKTDGKALWHLLSAWELPFRKCLCQVPALTLRLDFRGCTLRFTSTCSGNSSSRVQPECLPPPDTWAERLLPAHRAFLLMQSPLASENDHLSATMK